MTITIYINGKETKKNIPTSWDEINFATFLKLDSCQADIIKVIALLTGIDYEILLKAKIKDMDNVIAMLAFLNKPPEPYIPKTLLGYDIPKDLAYEEVQQYVDLKEYVAKHRELTPLEQLEKYTLYCGVYACKQWKGQYDWKHAEALAPIFLNAPCTEVMGIGNFTLVRLIGLSLNINPSSPKANTLYKKFKLVLISWRKISVHIQRLFLWRKKQGLAPKNY